MFPDQLRSRDGNACAARIWDARRSACRRRLRCVSHDFTRSGVEKGSTLEPRPFCRRLRVRGNIAEGSVLVLQFGNSNFGLASCCAFGGQFRRKGRFCESTRGHRLRGRRRVPGHGRRGRRVLVVGRVLVVRWQIIWHAPTMQGHAKGRHAIRRPFSAFPAILSLSPKHPQRTDCGRVFVFSLSPTPRRRERENKSGGAISPRLKTQFFRLFPHKNGEREGEKPSLSPFFRESLICGAKFRERISFCQ